MNYTDISLAKKYLGFLVALALYAPGAMTQDLDALSRIERLEATVEELTFQLAKSLEENRRMELALKEAISGSRQGKVVVTGCDLSTFHRARAYDNWDWAHSKQWVKSNAKKCSKLQLSELRKSIVSNISQYLRGAPLSVIDYELTKR